MIASLNPLDPERLRAIHSLVSFGYLNPLPLGGVTFTTTACSPHGRRTEDTLQSPRSSVIRKPFPRYGPGAIPLPFYACVLALVGFHNRHAYAIADLDGLAFFFLLLFAVYCLLFASSVKALNQGLFTVAPLALRLDAQRVSDS